MNKAIAFPNKITIFVWFHVIAARRLRNEQRADSGSH